MYYIELIFCEPTKTANGVENAITADQTSKRVTGNRNIQNCKRKWTVFPIQQGRYKSEIEKWCDPENDSDESTAITTSTLVRIQLRNAYLHL